MDLHTTCYSSYVSVCWWLLMQQTNSLKRELLYRSSQDTERESWSTHQAQSIVFPFSFASSPDPCCRFSAPCSPTEHNIPLRPPLISLYTVADSQSTDPKSSVWNADEFNNRHFVQTGMDLIPWNLAVDTGVLPRSSGKLIDPQKQPANVYIYI